MQKRYASVTVRELLEVRDGANVDLVACPGRLPVWGESVSDGRAERRGQERVRTCGGTIASRCMHRGGGGGGGGHVWRETSSVVLRPFLDGSPIRPSPSQFKDPS